MSWWAWLGLGMLWAGTLQRAYKLGQKQSMLFAAQLLENSRYNIGKDLATRIRQEYDVRLRDPLWFHRKNNWPAPK